MGGNHWHPFIGALRDGTLRQYDILPYSAHSNGNGSLGTALKGVFREQDMEPLVIISELGDIVERANAAHTENHQNGSGNNHGRDTYGHNNGHNTYNLVAKIEPQDADHYVVKDAAGTVICKIETGNGFGYGWAALRNPSSTSEVFSGREAYLLIEYVREHYMKQQAGQHAGQEPKKTPRKIAHATRRQTFWTGVNTGGNVPAGAFAHHRA
jgi:hypothetical protein